MASTGVAGLDAIVPISAISSWYEYYRTNGLVHGPDGYQGEDLEIHGEAVYSRPDREICKPQLQYLTDNEDRVTGDYNATFDARNYLNNIGNFHAAVLLAHGNTDWNVMSKGASDLDLALQAHNIPHQFYFHQGGHGGSPPDVMINRWFTRYLYGVQNGVESLPKLYVVRESFACPISSTAAGDQTNVTNVAVVSSSSFSAGVVPAISGVSPSRTVTAVPDATHITLSGLATTISGASTTISGGNSGLALATAVGDSIIKTGSVSNFAAGQTVVIDSGAAVETAIIATVGTAGAAGTGITLTAPLTIAHAPGVLAVTTTLVGATNVKVGSVTNFAVGQTVSIDAGARAENATISAVGTTGATGTGITLAGPLAFAHPSAAAVVGILPAGTTLLRLGSVTNMAVGHTLTIDTGSNAESGSIASLGAGGNTTLGLASAVGDTNIKLPSVSGFAAGNTIWLDAGTATEAAVIATVGGSGASTVRIASAVGATTIQVVSTTGFANGSTITIGSGATMETRVVSSTSTSGSNPRVVVTAALANAHAVGEQISGSGVTLTGPLAIAHAVGAMVTGTAVVLAAPTTIAHASGAAVVDPLSGINIANGALIYQCSTTYPTAYPEWPDANASPAVFSFRPGAPAIGGLTLQTADPTSGTETLTDNAFITVSTSMNAASSGVRLLYRSTPAATNLRISGTPWVTVRMAFSKERANLTAVLMYYPAAGGNGTILDYGWMDPLNRNSVSHEDPIVPGTFYDLHFDMQPKDMTIPAGSRIGVMILSSDNAHTIRPAAGTQLTLDLAHSSFSLPIVGGTGAVGGAFGGATTTTIAQDYDPTQYGHPVTFSATVAPVASSAGTPTGNVQFNLDGAPAGAPVPLDAAGKATWAPTTLAIGTHTVSVDYLGADYFTPSSSATINHIVKKRLATTTAVTSGLNPSVYGGPVTFTATVNPENLSSGITPTGFVQWKVDGAPVGGPVALNAVAQATLTTNALLAGHRNIRAVYAGDPNYTGSTSPAFVQTVNKATPTGIVISDPPSPVGYGIKPITFTALFANPAPIGSLTPAMVQFLIDGTNMGVPVALDPSYHAIFKVTWNLPVGNHTVKARYLGGADFAPAFSAPYPFKVNP